MDKNTERAEMRGTALVCTVVVVLIAAVIGWMAPTIWGSPSDAAGTTKIDGVDLWRTGSAEEACRAADGTRFRDTIGSRRDESWARPVLSAWCMRESEDPQYLEIVRYVQAEGDAEAREEVEANRLVYAPPGHPPLPCASEQLVAWQMSVSGGVDRALCLDDGVLASSMYRDPDVPAVAWQSDQPWILARGIVPKSP